MFDISIESTDRILTDLIRAGGTELACTEPVMMEVLAGAADDVRYAKLKRLLISFAWLPADPSADFEGAAKKTQACRGAGITPRGIIDWMIGSIAIRTGADLLTQDGGFAAMATILPLRLARATQRLRFLPLARSR